MQYLFLHNYDAVIVPGHILMQWDLGDWELVLTIIDKSDYAEA